MRVRAPATVVCFATILDLACGSASPASPHVPPAPDGGIDALTSAHDASHDTGASPPDAAKTSTFAEYADVALAAMKASFYDDGSWKLCAPDTCTFFTSDDFDWGADDMTAALYLRWLTAKDASIVPMMQALNAGGSTYGTCTAAVCFTWSDVPTWDSIAASHEHIVTGAASALTRAEAAFAYVDTATEFALGACPGIDYQIAQGGSNDLKTLETDSNYIKAALLLYQLTGTPSYLAKAESKYASVRQYFLDPKVPLYTVYVFDDGTTCTTIPDRFFGSVNGNMIWDGLALYDATGVASYETDALATAHAVADDLSDANGVYADLQSENDVVAPLIEAMYALATAYGQSFARDWLVTNAAASAGARTTYGAYGRFFDGPPPPAEVTEWQANGGFALAFAAGGVSPDGVASANASAWKDAKLVKDDLTTLPSQIEFTGKAIAVYGTIGEDCCALGQASVFIDGVQTFDQTGIHQNESEVLKPVPDTILFAWRWPESGHHTLRFEAGPANPKDGGPFLHVQSYSYVP